MARSDIDITLPDLTGRRVVLTGGSDGMGVVMAERLVDAGAELVLPVRNRAKARASSRGCARRPPPRGSRCTISTCRHWHPSPPSVRPFGQRGRRCTC